MTAGKVKKQGWIRRLVGYMKPHKKNAYVAFGVAIGGQLIQSLLPAVQKVVIDDVITHHKKPLAPWLTLMIAMGVLTFVFAYFRRLRELANERVVFTGHINDQRVIKELHCNCFAYVHGHSVGGTNPSLLKAMGYGNCILALDTVFNSEVLGGTGLLFAKDSAAVAGAMRRIEADPNLVARLRTAGPKRIAAEYTWDKISAQYDSLFRGVAAS